MKKAFLLCAGIALTLLCSCSISEAESPLVKNDPIISSQEPAIALKETPGSKCSCEGCCSVECEKADAARCECTIEFCICDCNGLGHSTLRLFFDIRGAHDILPGQKKYKLKLLLPPSKLKEIYTLDIGEATALYDIIYDGILNSAQTEKIDDFYVIAFDAFQEIVAQTDAIAQNLSEEEKNVLVAFANK